MAVGISRQQGAAGPAQIVIVTSTFRRPEQSIKLHVKVRMAAGNLLLIRLSEGYTLTGRYRGAMLPMQVPGNR
jgi:hypothetical protein